MNGIDFIYAILGGLIPSMIWLFFWTREDNHPEPRVIIAGCFLGGMLSVVAAFYIERYIAGLVSDSSIQYIFWAATEEIVKFGAVAAIALFSIHNDEPIDAMIYCITVAIGFAALENMIFIMGWLGSGDVLKSIVSGDLRFIGATLVHIVSSGVIGFALGLTFYRKYLAKTIAIIISVGVAIALHAAFNISVNGAKSMEALGTFSWVWATVVIMIVLFEEVKTIRPKLL